MPPIVKTHRVKSRPGTATQPFSCGSARIRELALREIGFVHNTEFEKLSLADVGEEIDADSDPTSDNENPDSALREPTIPSGRLLKPDEERRLFRQYNFLKYRANVLRSLLHEHDRSQELVDEIESAVSCAEQIRDVLVRTNLRLAASIARRYCHNETDFDELLAEASVILLRAVEKFDYSRGFRFSTYATHAIQRHLFRVLQRRQNRSRREREWREIQVFAPDGASSDTPLADAEALHRLDQLWERAGECLTSREQSILRQRFGLRGNRQPRTLKGIARDVGLSKERVRQIQFQALEKLRRFAADEGLWVDL